MKEVNNLEEDADKFSTLYKQCLCRTGAKAMTLPSPHPQLMTRNG